MTDQTPPAPKVGWEPIAEGVRLYIDASERIANFRLPMISVRELRDDMEEANFLARGREKIDCYAHEVYDGDVMTFLGTSVVITDVLQAEGLHGEQTILQSRESEHELMVPSDMLVTVWRETL